jgi:hypothetical protein
MAAIAPIKFSLGAGLELHGGDVLGHFIAIDRGMWVRYPFSSPVQADALDIIVVLAYPGSEVVKHRAFVEAADDHVTMPRNVNTHRIQFCRRAVGAGR